MHKFLKKEKGITLIVKNERRKKKMIHVFL